ncbi:hypothetical protein FQA39_LY05598 [Lamprigera yunnana]|nr:hypothetical protein FQA39_LY05598 [Lamprigera yunnana]
MCLFQKTIFIALAFTIIVKAVPPIGHKNQSSNTDESPPKYEYRYDIKSDEGSGGQGKAEVRDGILASGRYYVDDKNSTQNVEYIADDWGYHPFVEYQTTGPHSRSRAQLAYDKEAINTLNKKDTSGLVREITTTAKNQDTLPNQDVAPLSESKADSKNVDVGFRQNQVTFGGISTVSPLHTKVDLSQREEVQSINTGHSEDSSTQNGGQYYHTYTNKPLTNYVYFDQNLNQVPRDSNNLFKSISFDDIVPINYANPEYQHPITSNRNQQLEANNAHLIYEYPQFFFEQPEGYGTKIKSHYSRRPSKALHRFKDIISNQDVLDLNSAANLNVEASTTASIIVQDQANVGSTNPIITKMHSLSDQPIIVPDNEENHRPTVLVTPKPISNALLTPRTAANNHQILPKDEEKPKLVHENYIIDVQKSIPYYLGKLEYYDENAQHKEKNVTVSATQHIRLGSFLQQPIIEKSKVEPLVQELPFVKFSQTFKSNQHLKDLKEESAEEIKVVENESAPINSIKKEENFTRSTTNKPYHSDKTEYIAKIAKYVQAPVQVHKEKTSSFQYAEVPVPVQKVAERVLPHYAPKPYPFLQVPGPVTHEFYLPMEVPKQYPVEITKLFIPTQYPLQAASTLLPQINTIEGAKPGTINNENIQGHANIHPRNLFHDSSMQSLNRLPCIDLRLFGIRKPYCPKMNNNHYIGMVPPKVHTPFHYIHYNSTQTTARKQRTAREGVLSNIRWEYGFMPPLIPSLAIDENGNPIEKHTK